jgi:metal-sulfur cluster biosynthetic enzyme
MSVEEVDIRELQKQISKVVDPEIGMPIAEMNLIDKIDVRDGEVNVEYHATTQFCPPIFALKISQDIRDNLTQVKGVKSVKVVVTGHYFAEAINRQVNKPTTGEVPQPAPSEAPQPASGEAPQASEQPQNQ